MSHDEKKKELESLKGKERLEKAVALHIHAINTPLMIIEGYLPEEDSQGLDEKGVSKIRKSVEKLKNYSKELKGELVEFRSNKED